MAQPSVAREPSMEEILASIRRIIESNEPGAPADEPSAQPEPEADFLAGDEISTDFADASHPVVADSTGAPLRAANTAVPPRIEREVAATPAERPQSLADIAARVRGASERAEPRREEAAAAPVRPVQEPLAPPQAFVERPVAVAPPPQPAAPEAALRLSAPLRGSAPAPSAPLPAFDEAAISAAGEVIARYETETASATPARPVAPPVYAVPAPESAPAPSAFEPVAEPSALSLISSRAGEMVARSFGELAEAVDGAQRRSLDEMAEELLRPMLRDWLDDNLPTLVERLVREEIERVARGPRR